MTLSILSPAACERVPWPPVRDVPLLSAAEIERRVASHQSRIEAELAALAVQFAPLDPRRVNEIKRRAAGVEPANRPVVCEETGRRFETVAAAARACGTSRVNVSEALRRNGGTFGTLPDGRRAFLHFRDAGRGDGGPSPAPEPARPRRARDRAVVCRSDHRAYHSVTAAVGGFRRGDDRNAFKRRWQALVRAIERGRFFEGKRWAWA